MPEIEALIAIPLSPAMSAPNPANIEPRTTAATKMTTAVNTDHLACRLSPSRRTAEEQ